MSALRIKVSFPHSRSTATRATAERSSRAGPRDRDSVTSWRPQAGFFLHLQGDCSGINWSSNVETYKTGPPEIALTGATDGRRTTNRMCSVQGSIKADDLIIQAADIRVLLLTFHQPASSWHGEETAGSSSHTPALEALGRGCKAVLASSTVIA